jgi:hypothetical protein
MNPFEAVRVAWLWAVCLDRCKIARKEHFIVRGGVGADICYSLKGE